MRWEYFQDVISLGHSILEVILKHFHRLLKESQVNDFS